MSDSNQTAATPAKKAKTVAEDMPQRSVFETPELASAFLNRLTEELSDFGEYPLATRGLDDEGNFDSEVYTPDMRVMVAKLMKHAPKGSGESATVKAIVITPIPSIDAILADATGKTWLTSIIDKELNHVAVRKLREAEDISTVLDQMPTTLAGYVTSGRESGGMMEAFDETFKRVLAVLASKSKVWEKARLTKNELKKALESKAYASSYYPTLEDRGADESLFVLAIKLGIALAEKDGHSPAIYQRWLETRDAKQLGADEDEDFDLDDLLSTATESKEEAPATE